MDNEEEVVVPETTEEVVVETTEGEEGEETIEQVRERALKAEELAKNYKIRAEKAEKKPKETVVNTETKGNISISDLHAIKDVHGDDVERLERFAKAEGLSLKDAVKNPEWKAIENLRVEQRNTASAANVGNVRRSPTKTSDEALISAASQGKFPDSDEEIRRLIKAKAGYKQG